MKTGGQAPRSLEANPRFAAGGFVFLSGLCIGFIFLPRVLQAVRDTGSPMKVYRRIWARAAKIYFIQLLSSFLLVWFCFPEQKKELLDQPAQYLCDMLCFRRGNDLLLMYVGMVAVSPLMLELLRRRLWPILATARRPVYLPLSRLRA